LRQELAFGLPEEHAMKIRRMGAVMGAAIGVVVITVLLAGQPAAADGLFSRLKASLMGTKPPASSAPAASALSVGEIGEGLKEALRVGTGNVVANLGRFDGFYTDPVAHIPLPQNLRRPRDLLRKVGLGALAEDLEEKLNRAAEVATPRAKVIFWQAIREMTLGDVMGIYNGPPDSATRYFQRKMTPALIAEMRPVIEASMSEVGVVRAYDNFAGQYSNIPFVPDLKGDLINHVLTGTLDGIFYYVAREEAAIRQNPVKRTSDILKKVFGAF
jgi:hypothetical protein